MKSELTGILRTACMASTNRLEELKKLPEADLQHIVSKKDEDGR